MEHQTPKRAIFLSDLWDAYLQGVRDGQENREASPIERSLAADGYVKLFIHKTHAEPLTDYKIFRDASPENAAFLKNEEEGLASEEVPPC